MSKAVGSENLNHFAQCPHDQVKTYSKPVESADSRAVSGILQQKEPENVAKMFGVAISFDRNYTFSISESPAPID